jgi:signal transduction protein with GAF and PtsI domain
MVTAGLRDDVAALTDRADGIGLFRTEFPVSCSRPCPSASSQQALYASHAAAERR